MSLLRILGPPAAPAGALARLAAFAAAAGWLVYAGEKVYMAAIGKIGMPGQVAPVSVQERFDHASLAQAANATLGLLAAVIALATVHRWAFRIPGRAMLAVLVATSVPVVAGMAVMFTRLLADADGPVWRIGLNGALVMLQALPWLVVVMTYARRTMRATSPVASMRHGVAT